MDWFSWLSKTGLEASLVYEYGLTFGQNELEEEDMSYFNHEFLQSMGISIAKHRLEILKLARKDKRRKSSLPLAVAIKTFSNYVRTKWLMHREEQSISSAIVVLPLSPSRPKTWKTVIAMIKRPKNKNQDTLFLTNPTSTIPPAPPVLYHFQKDGDYDDDRYCSSAVQEIKWDTMFHDLNPN